MRMIRQKYGHQVRLNPIKDYETYRQIQQEDNERKLQLVYARQADLTHLAHYAQSRIQVHSVLCHGTRNGAEQKWFKEALDGDQVRVLGTEISTTAHQFADTIQWDFHDIKPEWVGAWDIIYTNAWDHAFDPTRAFKNWLDCLSAQGMLFLEHSKNHEPAVVNDLDPFGATLNGLIKFVNSLAPDRYHVKDVIVDLPDASSRRVVVAGRV